MKKKVLLLIVIFNLSACSAINQQDPRSIKTEWLDNQLTVQAVTLSNRDPFLDNLRLNAISYDGNLILLGQARTFELKKSFLDYVSKMEGVKQVYDQIHVKEPVSLSQITKDTWLTAKVKSSLFRNKNLEGSNIKVISEDGEVFLFGYVTPEQAEIATETVRHISGVKRVIQGWFALDS